MSRQGFTLIEVVVVMVLTSIIMTVGLGCSADVHVGDSVNDVPVSDQAAPVEVVASTATCEMGTVVIGARENLDYTIVQFADGTRGAREGVWGYRQDKICVTRITRNNPTRVSRNNAFYEKDMKLQMFDVTWR